MKPDSAQEQWLSLFRRAGYPRSNNYDPQWIVDNALGSHCIWLTEAITGVMDLRPGMRVLDLGCGRAISSIFLAREFGVQVWAVDIGVPAGENLERIRAAGVEERVFPLRADARSLPFADGFFDAVVSINAYWIFGTDDFYLPRGLAPLLKPGAMAGLIVPGLKQELTGELPGHIKPYWISDVIAYHSPSWWRTHLERSGLVDVLISDCLEGNEGIDIWRDWARIKRVTDPLIENDHGRNISFVRLLVKRKTDDMKTT
ncbi:MAG: SAM-dependent methyltransferase [Chloroflexota bacterium]